ncbi:putative reverse transcriptase domain-containing protein [Tanacetum coccineum]
MDGSRVGYQLDGFCYCKGVTPKDSRFELTAFSDVNHARCLDTRKSTYGGIRFLGEKLFSWMSKKQDCIAMSTTEEEYVALSKTLAISCNPVQQSHTKHINVRYHFIKEQVEHGISELYFVRTEYQLVDMFMKALSQDRFEYLVRRLGMRCLTPAELEVLANETALIDHQTSKYRDGQIASHLWQAFQKALGIRLDMSTAYHPQTDSQSERTIQTLEDMLRACVMDFGVGESQLIRPEIVQETIEKIVHSKERLKAARSRQKSYADKRHKPLEFKVGDRVLLKVSPWKGVVLFGKKGSYHHDIQVPLEEIEIDENLRFLKEPIEIVARDVKKLKQRRIPLVKVLRYKAWMRAALDINLKDSVVIFIRCKLVKYCKGVTPKDSGFELTAFSDANHARCLNTRKSTSRGSQFLGEKIFRWMSKKQDCIAMSTTEEEYVALSITIAISYNPVQHSRTKHINVRYHFIKEQVERGISELYFVRTEYQLADMFKKALSQDRFEYLVRRLGMRCLTSAELEVLVNETA